MYVQSPENSGGKNNIIMTNKAILSNGRELSIEEGINVLGLMSGTSLDGLDLCLVNFKYVNGRWQYSIIKAEDEKYPQELHEKLANAQDMNAEEYACLHTGYGMYLGARVKAFIERNSLEGKVDLVASHGQTVFHQPKVSFHCDGVPAYGWTGQIGCGAGIAAVSGVDCVCDFRTTDVAFGGQGAPLVPVGDRNLFTDFDFCLNIGGFSNISFDNGSSRSAFDISPVNYVLNHYAGTIGLDYDKDGALARSGKVCKELFDALNALDYYNTSGPKSLGREWVEQNIFPLVESYGLELKDAMATYTEHAAWQVARTVKKYSGAIAVKDERMRMLVTGGGAFNKYLVERMAALAPECEFIVPDALTVCFKEALIFAFLGALYAFNIPSCLSSVTGARVSNMGGALYKAGF